jgi:hypothetical protein
MWHQSNGIESDRIASLKFYGEDFQGRFPRGVNFHVAYVWWDVGLEHPPLQLSSMEYLYLYIYLLLYNLPYYSLYFPIITCPTCPTMSRYR